MEPTPVTTAKGDDLVLRGVMSCSCSASTTCKGVWVAIHMPRLARARRVIQRYRTCWVGSASASDRTVRLADRLAAHDTSAAMGSATGG